MLAGNPLGDPYRRPLYVYSSPGVASGAATDVACVHVLQGFTGQLDAWLARSAFEPTMIERLDAMFSDAGNPCPDAVVVFVDAWTSLGGAQFLNSTAIGNYTDYICDEVVPFVDANYPTDASSQRRAVAGKSSGGYGAMVLPMLRPDIFGALASHAGDALFEVCYLPDFAKAARALRDNFDGSLDAFKQQFAERDRFDHGHDGDVLNMYAMAAAYSPDPDHPTEVLLPFDLRTGRLIPDVWEHVARARPGADGPQARGGAAGPATRLPGCRARGRVLPRPRRTGVRRRARQRSVCSTRSSCSPAAMAA